MSSNSSLLADPSSVGAVFLGDLNAEPQEEAMMYLRGAKADPIEHIHTSRLKVNIIRHSFSLNIITEDFTNFNRFFNVVL